VFVFMIVTGTPVRRVTFPQSVTLGLQVWIASHEMVVLDGLSIHQQKAEVPVLVKTSVKLLGRVLDQVNPDEATLTTGGAVSEAPFDVKAMFLIPGIAADRRAGVPIEAIRFATFLVGSVEQV
jgi:hypothetical protein